MNFRLPPPIRPGSLVAVVAPASPADREELFRGLAWLRTRYRLRGSSALLERHGYLSADDATRARDLAAAMVDPDVEAIVCSRGGYGAIRIVDALPWDRFASSPKWICGFSDVTALHAVANLRGIATIHAPNVTGLGRSISAAEREALVLALEGKPPRRNWTCDLVHPGEGSGPIVGGNLAIVVAMAAAGKLVVPRGAVLALEDVTERPYRIDRMLTALRLGGYLANASAIVFGGFTSCDPGPDGTQVLDVLADVTRDLRIPVVANAPFGHGSPNESFVTGRTVTTTNGTVEFS